MARSVRRGAKLKKAQANGAKGRWWRLGRRLELDALGANDGWWRESEDVWKALPR